MEQRLVETNVVFAAADSGITQIRVKELCKKIPADFSGTIVIHGNLVGGVNEKLILPKANLFVAGRVLASDIMVNDLFCTTLVCDKAKILGMAVIIEDAVCNKVEVASDLFAAFINAEDVLVSGDFSYHHQDIEFLVVMGEVDDKIA